MINNNIINIYNMLATITVLKQLGFEYEQINNSLKNQKIVDTRYSKTMVNDIEVVTQLAKGMNPIACSRAFDYARKEEGNKIVFLLLDDLHEAASGSENIAWYYDTDFEFLKDDSIKQILVGGIRNIDVKVRLEIADIPMEKVVCCRDEYELVDKMDLSNKNKIFILHDLYSLELKENIKEKVIERVKESGDIK